MAIKRSVLKLSSVASTVGLLAATALLTGCGESGMRENDSIAKDLQAAQGQAGATEDNHSKKMKLDTSTGAPGKPSGSAAAPSSSQESGN